MVLAQLNLGPLSLPLWGLLPILSASVAIPVVLHLLSSVRAPQVRFSTLRFLRLSMEKTARRRRVQHWLLLLLRTALIALLLLAVTQPLYKPKQGLAGRDAQMAAAIVVDNSLSMAASDGPRRRFEVARSVAKDLLRGVGKPSELALVFTNGRAAQAEPALTHDLTAAIRRLDAATVGMGQAELSSAVGVAVEAIQRSSQPSRAVYVLSDMQQASFEMLSRCKALAQEERIPLFVLDCGEGDGGNVGVVDLKIHGQGHVVGATLRFEATVLNSSAESRRVKVGLEVDGVRQAHLNQTVLLTRRGTPGNRQKVVFEHAFSKPGPHQGRVVLDAANDVLPEDDVREFALEIAGDIRVLVIAGPGGSDTPTGPGYYVLSALKVPSAIRPITRTVGDVTPRDIAGNALVVCCDVPSFDPALASALRRLLVGGGTLVVFVGPNVDVASYNAVLGTGEPPILPATLGEPMGDAVTRRDAHKLLRVELDHPLFRDLYDSQEPYQSVLAYAHLTAAVRGSSSARPIAWLERDRPFLLEHRVGAGRCYLCTTSANTIWTNLPTKPVFLPMLLRMCLSTVAGADSPTSIAEGSRVVLPVTGDEPREIDVVLPPDENGRSATVRIRSAPQDGQNVAVFTETFTRGAYAWQTAGKPEQSGQFVVSPDGKESDLGAMGERQLVESLPDQSVVVAGNLDELREAIHQAARGTPAWDYFLIAVLILATVEALFANRYRPAEVRVPAETATAAA